MCPIIRYEREMKLLVQRQHHNPQKQSADPFTTPLAHHSKGTFVQPVNQIDPSAYTSGELLLEKAMWQILSHGQKPDSLPSKNPQAYQGRPGETAFMMTTTEQRYEKFCDATNDYLHSYKKRS